MRSLPVFVLCVALTVAVSPAFAQTGSNVLLVANANSPDSVRIAEAYARARAVPQDQVLRIKVDPAADEIDREVYDRGIQATISEWLTKNFAQDRILYIVLTKGVPLRVKGTTGRDGTVSSVDSELAVLYRRLTGVTALVAGAAQNPYYAGALGDQPFDPAAARPFTHADYDIYLVTRLTGFTVDDALALVERATSATGQGKIVLDQVAGLSDSPGDQWLKAAGDWLAGHGFGDRVVLDRTTGVVTGEKDVLGYYSWGSNDPAVRTRHFDLGFVPGAIGGMFVSTDARTFNEPPPDWNITTRNDRTRFFAGSPQSLIGDLIRDGITGVSGYVSEPYLDNTVRPSILFPAYLSGFNLAESYYLALPSVSWQAVIVGDPLCAPFMRATPHLPEIDKGLDPATELPAFFSARAAKAMAATGAKPEAIPHVLRAQARTAKDDKPGARKALEDATAIDARLDAAHLLLATAYEEQKEYDKAIERYRAVLANKPANAIALNNLAYALAVHKNQPAEALPLAERAYALAPTPVVADTLAWVQHLLGRSQEAARLLADAARRLPDNADIRLHAAVVFSSLGVLDAAEKELAAAVRLNPDFEKRPEVQELRGRLRK